MAKDSDGAGGFHHFVYGRFGMKSMYTRVKISKLLNPDVDVVAHVGLSSQELQILTWLAPKL